MMMTRNVLFVCLIWGSGSVAFKVDIQQPGCIYACRLGTSLASSHNWRSYWWWQPGWSPCYLFVLSGVQALLPSCIPTWIFNNRAAPMHAALVHRWHLHIIEDLIDDDDQDDGQQPNHQGMLNASQLKHSTIILVWFCKKKSVIEVEVRMLVF